ncbi:MAG: FAD-dependent oxidoreductase [Vulcanimicrobiota bacterium]
MSSYDFDAVIVGGGVSGCMAALALARFNKSTLVIEKKPCLGGMATAARVHSMLTFHGKKGHKIIGGIPQLLIDVLKKTGGTPGHIRDTIGVAYSVTPTDPGLLSLTLMEMMKRFGVNYLLESSFLTARLEGKRIKQIRGIHPGGYFTASAPVFIDASGEGALAHACNEETLQDETAVMPATLIFEMNNVNLSQVVGYANSNPENFHHETLFDHLEKSQNPGFSGFFSQWKNAGLEVPRDRLLFYAGVEPGTVGINSTRIINFDPLSSESINNAYMEGHKQVLQIAGFLKKEIPGFENSQLKSIAPFLGVREVRRIKGKYVLTGEDLAMGRRFPDEVALGGFPIDIHKAGDNGLESEEVGEDGFYGIPCGSLVPSVTKNLFITGKCFSAQFRAHASARVQATSMAMGQAVGVAAALAIEKSTEPKNLDIKTLRSRLAGVGQILEPDNIEELEF